MEDDTASVEIDENPFSFKNFMKNQIILDGSVSDTNSSSNSFIDQKADDRKDTTEEVPFPNVNRDLEAIPTTKKKGKGKKAKQTGNKEQGIPGLQTDNPFSFKHFVKNDAAVKTSGRVLQIIDDEVHEIENSVTVIDVQGPAEETTKFIPGEGSQDFIGLENHPNSAKLDSQESRSPKELGDEITKLKNENRKLQIELKEAKQSKDDESKRVLSLIKKLKEIEDKENEETAALEKMVHMVERNLELTTQRALKAEALNAKLREENKLLKTNSVSKAMYEDLLSKHCASLASIKDQAICASQHLDMTAKKAEESLKQLYSGVDTFKLVSQLLMSIDKLTNHCDEPQT